MRKKIFALFFLLFLFSLNSLQAQKIIEYQSDWGIKHPDLPDVFILTQNVAFKHEGMLLYADSAHLNTVKNSFEAFNHIKINVNDTLFIYGDVLHYDGNKKLAQISGHVKLVDDSTVLITDNLQYDRVLSVCTYPFWGLTTDKGNKLYSKKGYYYNKLKDFYFKDSVVIQNADTKIISDTLHYNTVSDIATFFGPTHIYNKEDNYIYTEKGWYNTQTNISEMTQNPFVRSKEQSIKADYIYYEQKSKYGLAKNNITIQDTVNKLILKGNYSVTNNAKHFALMTDNALAMFIEEGNDTLYMHADTLYGITDTAENFKQLHAYHQVKFFRNDFQGMSDSLYYSIPDSLMDMYIKPVVWFGESQFSADTLRMISGSKGLKNVYLENSCFIISQSDTLQPEQFDQIKGKKMTGFFLEKNVLERVLVNGNAESVYYIREDQPDKTQALIGVNAGIGADMNIWMENKKPVRIVTLGKPEMTTYPEEQLPADKKQLMDFNWQIEERPKNKEDIFRKRIFKQEETEND